VESLVGVALKAIPIATQGGHENLGTREPETDLSVAPPVEVIPTTPQVVVNTSTANRFQVLQELQMEAGDTTNNSVSLNSSSTHKPEYKVKRNKTLARRLCFVDTSPTELNSAESNLIDPSPVVVPGPSPSTPCPNPASPSPNSNNNF